MVTVLLSIQPLSIFIRAYMQLLITIHKNIFNVNNINNMYK